ncbi:MAG: hypothetical protein Q4P13_07640 [Psychrobacter sp.]|nr:hypothetical protein [Psychrobacter sp.]
MTDNKIIIDDERSVTLDQAVPGAAVEKQYATENPEDSYAGRKHKPEIDGPQQASQETDEIFSDPRKEEDLPPGGKNVADLNVADLSQEGNL